MSAPTVTRSPDGTVLLETVDIDSWAAFVTILANDATLRVHLLRACRSGDGRLKAYAAWRLYEACGVPFQTVLTGPETAELAEALDNARQQPEPCFYCQEDAEAEVSGIHMCHEHLRAHDSLAEFGVEGK